MRFDWSTFALQVINFALLVWLLTRFLYRPVQRLMDARRAQIDQQYAQARALQSKAATELSALQAAREEIAAERVAALKSAEAAAASAAASRRTQAELEARGLLEQGRSTLERERTEALAEARRAALGFGAAVAARLLAELPEELRLRPWLERIEQSLGALPAGERQALAAQLSSATPLRVVSALALAPPLADAWRARLQQLLGPQAAIAFEIDPQLIAGLELHFPQTLLRFSWRSALASIELEALEPLAPSAPRPADADR